LDYIIDNFYVDTSDFDSIRSKKKYANISRLIDIKFINGSRSNVVIFKNKDIVVEKQRLKKEILEIYEQFDYFNHKKKMDIIKEEFRFEKCKTLFDDIMRSDDKVFVIQDYMNLNLTELLKKGVNDNVSFSVISDIRSNVKSNYPTDFDYVWNDCIQMILVKILKPDFTMLKFHPPYGNYSIHAKIPEFAKPEIDYVKNVYNVDIVELVKNRKYKYLQNSDIWIQAWAPPSSSEARLFLRKEDIDGEFIEYSMSEWDNKFMYLKLLRMYGYFPKFYKKLTQNTEINNHPVLWHYDGCFDCALEMCILLNYGINSNKFDQDPEFDIVKLSGIKSTIDSVLINNIPSCRVHGYLTKPLEGLNYFVVDGKLDIIKVDGDNTTTKPFITDITKKINLKMADNINKYSSFYIK
jgi:hypothetical protein